MFGELCSSVFEAVIVNDPLLNVAMLTALWSENLMYKDFSNWTKHASFSVKFRFSPQLIENSLPLL